MLLIYYVWWASSSCYMWLIEEETHGKFIRGLYLDYLVDLSKASFSQFISFNNFFCVATMMTDGSNKTDLRSSISSELVVPVDEIQIFPF